MLDVIMIAVAVAGLWIGTEISVRAGGELGRRLGVSEMFLGLTVFTIGTNVSELVVSITAATQIEVGAEASGLILGNALGSVLAQGGLVLGVLFFLGGRSSAEGDTNARVGAFVWLGTTILLWFLMRDGRIGSGDAVALCVVYAGFFIHTCRTSAWRDRSIVRSEIGPAVLSISALIGGLVIVVYAANVAVEHSIAWADRSGVNPTAIGLFALGAGTSMPELAVSIGAVARGRPALSLGNILGSNIFDLLVPIGVAALIHPLNADEHVLRFDLPMIAVFAAFLGWRLTRSRTFARGDAMLLVVGYAAFVMFRLGTFVE